MPDELAVLIARANAIAQSGERLSAAFAAELASIWLQVERQVRTLAASVGPASSVLALRDRVRRVLTEQGYDGLVAIATREAFTAAEDIMAVRALQASSELQLQALRELAMLDLVAQGDAAAIAVWRAVAMQVVSHQPVESIIDQLAQILDRTRAQIRTIFDTQVSIYGRQVEAVSTDHLGPEQPYLYVGPIDHVTRDWCLERVGGVFSRRAIDEMDNGQLPDAFLTGGGWNCRHTFQAVESKALRDIVDTDQRIQPIAEDVSRARAHREALKAAKRKRAA